MKKETKNKKEDQVELLRKQLKDQARRIIELTLQHTSFLSKETVVPDVAARDLAKHFTLVEEGGELKVVAEDKSGQPIMSITHIGDTASIEEAAQILTENKYSVYLLPDSLRESKGAEVDHKQGGRKTLLSQYKEASAKGESTRMIQLKNQMFNDGITPPL
jgi:hypothetical protein